MQAPREMQYIPHFFSWTSRSKPSIATGNSTIQSSHMIFQLYAAIYPDKA